jgi:hypothetical protein
MSFSIKKKTKKDKIEFLWWYDGNEKIMYRATCSQGYIEDKYGMDKR